MPGKWMMFGVTGGLLAVLGGAAGVHWRRPGATAAVRGRQAAGHIVPAADTVLDPEND